MRSVRLAALGACLVIAVAACGKAAPETRANAKRTAEPVESLATVPSLPPTTVATVPPSTAPPCTAGYVPCLAPASDYDCAGGAGDGPAFTGPVTVTGVDVYALDSDGDGSACEPYAGAASDQYDDYDPGADEDYSEYDDYDPSEQYDQYDDSGQYDDDYGYDCYDC